MSSLMTERTTFVIRCLAVSPTPMGLIPGHLSRATSRQESRGDMLSGGTAVVQRRLARRARDWHTSTDYDLNAVHKRFQAWESRPYGPAAPLGIEFTYVQSPYRRQSRSTSRSVTCALMNAGP